MNDFQQLQELGKSHRQQLADITRLEAALESERHEHAETKAQLAAVNTSLEDALKVLERIATMSVVTISLAMNEADAWKQTAMKLRAIANAGWHSVVGVDDTSIQVDETTRKLPEFIEKRKR